RDDHDPHDRKEGHERGIQDCYQRHASKEQAPGNHDEESRRHRIKLYMTTTETTKYFEAVGRRKTAVARARITPAAKQSITINDKDVADYFVTNEMQMISEAAFVDSKIAQKFKVTAMLSGGGIHSQAEALRHAISRALLEY